MRLPRVDGFEVFIELRRASFAPRMILMTGSAGPEILRLAKELGAFACLEKPFDASLRPTVLAALGLRDDRRPAVPTAAH